jgi:hypothetical protein
MTEDLVRQREIAQRIQELDVCVIARQTLDLRITELEHEIANLIGERELAMRDVRLQA